MVELILLFLLVEFVVDSNSPLASENKVHHENDATKPLDDKAVEVEVKELRGIRNTILFFSFY